MHILQQVAPPLGIGLARPRKPLQGGAVFSGGFKVTCVLVRRRAHAGLVYPTEDFLQTGI
jgi:hypothetical protein